MVLLSVFSPKMSIGPITSNQRPTAVHAVKVLDFSSYKESQGSVISRESDGLDLLRCNAMLFGNFQKDKTINLEYNANLLRLLRKAIKSKQPGKLTKGVLFHQYTAPAHKPEVAMSTGHDYIFKLIDYPPYSPDLAPSNQCNGVVVRVSALQSVDLGLISQIKFFFFSYFQDFKQWYSQLLYLQLSKIGIVWRTSQQACLLCPWTRHLTGCHRLYVTGRWWGKAVYPSWWFQSN